MGAATAAHVPTGSVLAMDDRGVGLRATWRLSHGFINLSIWRDDVCMETFHLSPTDAARLVSFLVTGLADVASVLPAAPPLAVVPQSAATAPCVGRWRRGSARTLRRIASRLAPNDLRSG